jgi:hypothetical protein
MKLYVLHYFYRHLNHRLVIRLQIFVPFLKNAHTIFFDSCIYLKNGFELINSGNALLEQKLSCFLIKRQIKSFIHLNFKAA